jgi:DNA-binding response OmpR family regulator
MPRAQQGQTVLVVDDDRDLRRLVRRLLEPLGYVVHEASTAGAALSIAARERPAVVLLDVHLPDISGYEVLRRLRDEFGDQLAIVFLSGKRTEEFDRTAGMLLGADDYIVKPLGRGEFIARVRRAIDRSSAARAPETSNLTPREFEVLKLLADGLGQKKSRNRCS